MSVQKIYFSSLIFPRTAIKVWSRRRYYSAGRLAARKILTTSKRQNFHCCTALLSRVNKAACLESLISNWAAAVSERDIRTQFSADDCAMTWHFLAQKFVLVRTHGSTLDGGREKTLQLRLREGGSPAVSRSWSGPSHMEDLLLALDARIVGIGVQHFDKSQLALLPYSWARMEWDPARSHPLVLPAVLAECGRLETLRAWGAQGLCNALYGAARLAQLAADWRETGRAQRRDRGEAFRCGNEMAVEMLQNQDGRPQFRSQGGEDALRDSQAAMRDSQQEEPCGGSSTTTPDSTRRGLLDFVFRAWLPFAVAERFGIRSGLFSLQALASMVRAVSLIALDPSMCDSSSADPVTGFWELWQLECTHVLVLQTQAAAESRVEQKGQGPESQADLFAKDLATIMHSVGKLRRPVSEQFLAAWTRAATKVLAEQEEGCDAVALAEEDGSSADGKGLYSPTSGAYKDVDAPQEPVSSRARLQRYLRGGHVDNTMRSGIPAPQPFSQLRLWTCLYGLARVFETNQAFTSMNASKLSLCPNFFALWQRAQAPHFLAPHHERATAKMNRASRLSAINLVAGLGSLLQLGAVAVDFRRTRTTGSCGSAVVSAPLFLRSIFGQVGRFLHAFSDMELSTLVYNLQRFQDAWVLYDDDLKHCDFLFHQNKESLELPQAVFPLHPAHDFEADLEDRLRHRLGAEGTCTSGMLNLPGLLFATGKIGIGSKRFWRVLVGQCKNMLEAAGNGESCGMVSSAGAYRAAHGAQHLAQCAHGAAHLSDRLA